MWPGGQRRPYFVDSQGLWKQEWPGCGGDRDSGQARSLEMGEIYLRRHLPCSPVPFAPVPRYPWVHFPQFQLQFENIKREIPERNNSSIHKLSVELYSQSLSSHLRYQIDHDSITALMFK